MAKTPNKVPPQIIEGEEVLVPTFEIVANPRISIPELKKWIDIQRKKLRKKVCEQCGGSLDPDDPECCPEILKAK